MLATRVSSLVVVSSLLVPGAPIPSSLSSHVPFVGHIPPDHVVLGMHWVEGVAHEPAGWEVIVSPRFVFDLVAKTEFPDLVFKAIELLNSLGTVQAQEEKKNLVNEAYKDLSKEEAAEFQKILNEIASAQKMLQGQNQAFQTFAIWLRPELVQASLRRMSLEQGASLYLLRRRLEASTQRLTEELLEGPDDEEETEAEAKPEEPKPEGQG